ncbi:MAG: hypothetical protein J0L62_03555 [Bacteroidetes bacterium]|nr:hypothetical protein [Bacteroidota bacterium]
MNKLTFALLLLSTSLVSCAPQWYTVKKSVVDKKTGAVLAAPTGWKFMELENRILITPDSPDLGLLVFQVLPVSKPMKFTKQIIQKNMLPEDLAALVTDNYQLNQELTQFKILENSPEVLAGTEGFRLISEYKSGDGNPMKMLTVGMSQQDNAIVFEFAAPKRVYFDKYKPEIEAIISKFKISPEQKK